MPLPRLLFFIENYFFSLALYFLWSTGLMKEHEKKKKTKQNSVQMWFLPKIVFAHSYTHHPYPCPIILEGISLVFSFLAIFTVPPQAQVILKIGNVPHTRL